MPIVPNHSRAPHLRDNLIVAKEPLIKSPMFDRHSERMFNPSF
ncbi:hypothetical protein [Edaphobacter sp.]|nr:hypothetical protein [Edaphobacter sp.]HEU5340103.1 hypothetical protein [Edaphobacter sp.]